MTKWIEWVMKDKTNEWMNECMNEWMYERKNKQEAFRERRHIHVCELWPWVVTLTLSQGHIGLCH